MRINQLNHVALHVADLHISERFYVDTLGLTLMDRPAFNFPGLWFRLGEDQELHLIVREPKDGGSYSIPRERHFALRVDDIDAAAAHLRACGQAFEGPGDRPDGAQQIYLRDPDGHVIELCSLARINRRGSDKT